MIPLDATYCYTVKELAFAWNLSAETIRRLFEREPGVIVFCSQRRGRRAYRTMRIPGSVALRVQARMIIA